MHSNKNYQPDSFHYRHIIGTYICFSLAEITSEVSKMQPKLHNFGADL